MNWLRYWQVEFFAGFKSRFKSTVKCHHGKHAHTKLVRKSRFWIKFRMNGLFLKITNGYWLRWLVKLQVKMTKMSIFFKLSITWFVYLKLRNDKVFVTKCLIWYLNNLSRQLACVSCIIEKIIHVQLYDLSVQHSLISYNWVTAITTEAWRETMRLQQSVYWHIHIQIFDCVPNDSESASHVHVNDVDKGYAKHSKSVGK